MSPAESAEAVDLAYSHDGERGFTRRRAGRGFFYLDADGCRVEDPQILARIRSLAIPPAWTEVWISQLENGHLQATGRDVKGRKQYRYHPAWIACRDDVKYSSLVAFAQALPALRRQVDVDLRRRGLPREKVVATIVWLLDNAMIRIGNQAYAEANKSFGLTTLRNRHVQVEGQKARFAFRGKSGKEWRLTITDRRIARIVKGVQELPGQHLFQYLDEGERRTIASGDVNDYIRTHAGAGFTSKHFRTWGGTVRAVEILGATPLPDTQRQARIVLNAAIDAVADKLGNTRSVCRRCYIHHKVIDDWERGSLSDGLLAARRRLGRGREGLDRQEALVMRWLELQSQEGSRLQAAE